ncbi:MAG: beta-ketoacyl synthase N-terminal-like domain-containing protein [Acidobacteriota bacterium]
MTEAVAITGWGPVGPEGCGKGALAKHWAEGGPRPVEVDRGGGYHRRRGARLAARVDPTSLGEWLSSREGRRMSPPSRFAVAAARLALDDAGLGDDPGPDTAVITATSYGPSTFTESLLRQIFHEAPTAASPALFTESVANASAAQVALRLGARGPNVTITQRQAGPLLALAKGAREVASGRASRALVVAVDEAEPLLHAILDRFGALAGSRGGEEVARPFDLRRRGFLVSEGATACVLEPASAALERGGRVVGTIRAGLSAFDPSSPPAGWGLDPEHLAAGLAAGLARHGLGPADLSGWVSGACGSVAGDRLEAACGRLLWGADGVPSPVVPKAYGGEHGGALLSGALLALEGWDLAPTPGFAEADPELGPVPFAGGAVPTAGRWLVSSMAVGGAAAWAVLDRRDPGAGA